MNRIEIMNFTAQVIAGKQILAYAMNEHNEDGLKIRSNVRKNCTITQENQEILDAIEVINNFLLDRESGN